MHGRLGTTIWMHAACCAALTGALVAGCSLDERTVNAHETDAMPIDTGRGSSGSAAESEEDGGLRVMTPDRQTPPSTGGSGEGGSGEGGSGEGGSGEGGSGEGGSAAPTPQAGAEGLDDPDDDGGIDGGADMPCTAGNTLRPVEGWVDRSTNCVGIQGAIRVDWRDESFIQVTLATNVVCAEGFSAELEPSPFDLAFMLNLNEQERFMDTPPDYDAEAHGVVGFEFVVEPPDPAQYFGVMSEGVLYCTRITDLGTYTVALTDLHAECWNGNTGPTPDPRKLRSIGFYSGATVDDKTSFQFCVTDIVALTSLD